MNSKRAISLALLALLLLSVPLLSIGQLVANIPGGVTVTTGGDPVERTYNLANDGEAAIAYRFSIGGGGPRGERDDRGGPDDHEMAWRDSDEDDGPIYEWIDISDRDDVVDIGNLADDAFYGMYELGFEFPYYGEVYDEIGVHSNGFACFVDASAIRFFYPQWAELPNANPGAAESTPPPTLLAGNYQDLNPAVGGHIYFWTDGNEAIATWDAVPHYADGDNQDPWTFQIIINSDGFIKYQYMNVGMYDNAHDLLIGIQNEDRDRGFTVALDDNEYIEAEKAVGFGAPEAWINWVAVEPRSGELEPGSDVDFTLAFNPEDQEDGYYWANLIMALGEGERLVVPLAMSLNAPVGAIAGTITDAANDNPVGGALVRLTDVGMWTYTDEEGAFGFEDLPVRTYQLYVSASNFNDFEFGDLAVEANETADGSLGLLHGEFTLLDRDRVSERIAPESSVNVNFAIENGGNAAVDFTAERRLVGDANAEPWEYRRSYDLGESLNDDRLEGAVYFDDHFYVSGADGNNPNRIYKIDLDGNEVGGFEQAGHSRYGYKDLEWDGEWIWGAGEDTIFAFTTEGEVTLRVRGPLSPTASLAWDPVNGIMWVANTTTDIVAIDREGNALGPRLNRRGLRIYGLAFFPEDPDGSPLYVMDQNPDFGTRLYKMDPTNNDTMLVTAIDFPDSASAAGISITSQLDIYSYVMLAVCNSLVPNQTRDRLHLLQVAARRDWMMLDPEQGRVEPDDEIEFTLTLDANGLPPALFEGEIVFRHNGRGDDLILSVSLDVVEGPVQAMRDIPLNWGWNLISANLQPDEADFERLFAPLVEQGLVERVKDGAGHFYSPDADFNNIPDWDVAQGYQVKMRRNGSLHLEGMTVVPAEPIELGQGWNMISYFPRRRIDAPTGFAGIVDHLSIAKDGFGGFYVPRYGFNSMAPLREGQGYQLRVDESIQLIYNLERVAGGLYAETIPGPTHYDVAPTGSNFSLLILDAQEGEYSAWAGSRLVGAGKAANGKCGVTVWGDDPSTPSLDGSIPGEPLSIRRWDGEAETIERIALVEGEPVFAADGLFVGRVVAGETLPLTFGFASIYPNPFNVATQLQYHLPEASEVSLKLFDLTGRLSLDVFSGKAGEGLHSVIIDGSTLNSGVYIARLEANDRAVSAKLALVK